MEIDAGILLQALGGLLRRRDPLADLERAVQEKRLRAELQEWAPQGRRVELAELQQARRDYAIIGQRGAGKTALAFDLALSGPRRPVYAVDWRGAVPAGVDRAPASSATRMMGACLVYDEAALRIGVGRRDVGVWETMALARQRDQVVIWTSQAATAVDLNVLRQGVQLLWLVGESRWERPELLGEAQAARSLLQLVNEGPGTWCGRVNGEWIFGRCGLPPGWSEEVSTAWAR